MSKTCDCFVSAVSYSNERERDNLENLPEF